MSKKKIKTHKIKLIITGVFIIFIAFLSLISNLSNIYASEISKDEIPEILENATFYLFSSPECHWCVEIKKKMEASGQIDKINITYQNRIYQLPVVKEDPWAEDEDKLKPFGYLGKGIPQFSIVSDGEVKSAALFKNLLKSENLVDGHELLPAPGQTFSDYYHYIVNLLSPSSEASDSVGNTDFSIDVISSLTPSTFLPLQANPNFNPKLSEKNILIIGTAEMPISNPVFTGATIQKVLKELSQITLIKPTILYGTGSSDICDTCQAIPEVVKATPDDKKDTEEYYLKSRQIFKYPLSTDESATKENIASFFEASKKSQSKNNLVVLIGHGAEEGFPTWLNLYSSMSPEELKDLNDRSGAKNILVSGNCYGGIMATTMSCAFMGANPTTPASGCWEDADSGKDIHDYVSEFFKALNSPRADFNSDGKISFSEAHSYAILNGVEYDKPYTTEDALVDEYFKNNPEKLYDQIQVAYLQKFLEKKYATPEEKAAINYLAKDLNSADFITLKTKKGYLDLGPVAGNYIFDPDASDNPLTFSNVQIKDITLLKKNGLPEDIQTVSLSLGSEQVDNNSIKQVININYVNPDPTWGTYIDTLKKSDLEEKILAMGIESGFYETEDEKKEINFGPFKGFIRSFSEGGYINIDNLQVTNFDEFKKLITEKNLEDDLIPESLSSWSNEKSVYFSYKSKKENKKGVSYNSINYSLEIPKEIRLMLDQKINPSLKTMIRRLIFKSLVTTSSEPTYFKRLNEIEDCGNQSVADFLKQ